MQKSERVRLMIDGFIPLRKDGKTIAEIAEHFKVSIWSIYDNLQTIADKNGISRESLLSVPHKPHNIGGSKNFKSPERVDPEELKEDFAEINKRLESVVTSIDKVLEEQEENYAD